MPALSVKQSVDVLRPSEAETVALAYLREASEDRWMALVCLARDALAERERAEITIRDQGGLVSRGYIRAGLGQ